jgi:hypothetical protein
MVHDWFTKYNTRSMNPKFHDSCFDFMCRAMAKWEKIFGFKGFKLIPKLKKWP